MKLSRVTEVAFLESRMTMDAVRMESLAYQQIVEQQKQVIQKHVEKIEELEKKRLAQKEGIIKEYWDEEIKDDSEDEVKSAIKAAIDPGDPAVGACINLEYGRIIYLPPGHYSLSGEKHTPEIEE